MSTLGLMMMLVAASSQSSWAQPTTVVSPPGTADTEGNTLFFPINSPYPDFPDNPPLADGWRAQELHPASAFGALGTGPLTLTGLAWRPDLSVNEPISNEWQFDLNLATTDVGSLSTTFDENIPADGVTNVFSGTVELQTDGVPRGGGLPHDFDYVVAFDKPYTYDPQQGDLLVEWRFTSPFTTDDFVWVDAEDTVGEFVFGLSADAAEAFSAGPGLFVTEFTVIPEPSTWLLGLLLCTGVAAYRFGRRIVRRPTFALLIAAILSCAAGAMAQTTSIVVPAGLEHSEGNETVLVLEGAPVNGFRAQYSYLASDFSALPDGHDTIVSMAWRPDHTIDVLHTPTLDLELRLSTTSVVPGSLSSTFAQNVGDDETLVYSGPIAFQTDGSGPVEGPRPFDYLIDFQNPFHYDPVLGNLLVDFSIRRPATGALFLDSEATPLIQSVGETDASSPVATLTSNEAIPVQFTFTTDPDVQLAGYNGSQMVEQGDLDLVLLHWGEILSDPADVGWINDLPSGAVDQQELDKVLLNWGQTAAGPGSVGVPEPASGLLLLGGSVIWLVTAALTSIFKRKAAPTGW